MRKILIVDDEIDVCDFVKNFFEDRDFRVFTALNGHEAIRILRKEKPHLILLDIKMKEMDGVETLERIREISKDVKVIMVTAVEDQDKMETCCKLGACAYITKPLVLGELEKKVLSHAEEVGNA